MASHNNFIGTHVYKEKIDPICKNCFFKHTATHLIMRFKKKLEKR